MRRGGIGLCVATQIARYVTPRQSAAGLALAGAGLGADAGAARLVSRDGRSAARCAQIADLRVARRASRRSGRAIRRRRIAPIGYILSLEGADSIVTLGSSRTRVRPRPARRRPGALRPGRLRAGHRRDGGIGARGRELLQEMERLGIILDATHLCDDSFWEALDHLPRAGLGQPQQLPRARAAQPAVRRRSDRGC